MKSLKAWVILMVAFLLCHGRAGATDLFVASDGNDRWSGSPARPTKDGRDGPLASMEGARSAVRKLHPLREPVRVIIERGTYHLPKEIVFEPEDGGDPAHQVTYESESGEGVVLDGGIRLTGWSVGPDGTWSLPCNPEKIPEQLWVNGKRAHRASIPSYGTGEVLSVDETTVRNYGAKELAVSSRQTFHVRPEAIRGLSGCASEETGSVVFRILSRWDNVIRRIDSADADKGLIEVHGPEFGKSNPPDSHARFILENSRAGLERPGSWFYSQDHILIYRPLPGETPETSCVVLPVARRLLLLQGGFDKNGSLIRPVQHLKFRNLGFEHGAGDPCTARDDTGQASERLGAAILADGTKHISFENCHIAHVGEYGLWFRRGCRSNSVSHCLLEDLGAGGIRIGEGLPRQADQADTGENTVDNNIVRAGGRSSLSGVGILVQQSHGNHITHNLVRDFYYSGISLGWTWGYSDSNASNNLVLFNRIDEVGQGMLSDMGGIYLLGESPGTVVANNVISNVSDAYYGGYGLYADEGTSGVLFENNLVFRTSRAGFMQHYGRDNIVRNNILAGCGVDQLELGRFEKNHPLLTFTRNIVVWNHGSLFGGRWTPEAGIDQDRNLYWNASIKSPSLESLLDPFRLRGKEKASVIANPKFVDPDAGNFAFRSESPSASVGFVPFDFRKAGVYGDAHWVESANWKEEPFYLPKSP